MEQYWISPYHIVQSTGRAPENEPGFTLTLLKSHEWDTLPDLLPATGGKLETDRLTAFLPDPEKSPSGTETPEIPGIIPQMGHLAPETHFVCFRDLTREGRETALMFILTGSIIILADGSGPSLDQITRWAKRGVLAVPMDLANALAIYVFHHHQDQLDRLEQQLYATEKDILTGPRPQHQNQIMSFHRQVMIMRKSVNLHQAVFERLAEAAESPSQDLSKELQQATARLIDAVQYMHDMIENLRDAYQTAVQNYTNDIMKLLTIMATVLLPINLLTSFFGMNFINLPLIKTPFGIAIFYAVSGLSTLVVLLYFRHKRWFFLWHKNEV